MSLQSIAETGCTNYSPSGDRIEKLFQRVSELEVALDDKGKTAQACRSPSTETLPIETAAESTNDSTRISPGGKQTQTPLYQCQPALAVLEAAQNDSIASPFSKTTPHPEMEAQNFFHRELASQISLATDRQQVLQRALSFIEQILKQSQSPHPSINNAAEAACEIGAGEVTQLIVGCE